MKYIQVDINHNPLFSEILIAELSENGYDSFWERDEGSFIAYIEQERFQLNLLEEIKEKYPDAQVKYQYDVMETVNWNQEWEKNFQPICISDQIYVRASFHESENKFPIEIIIEPKMSFGTGHHATTSMMLEHLLQINIEDKNVMDVGTGSGILAIAAKKMGARHVFAFDIDDWSVENTTENIALNNISSIDVKKGTIKDFDSESNYDIILANITRNILLDEIQYYALKLRKNGYLIISGFYKEDIDLFGPLLKKNSLIIDTILEKDNWASIRFIKN
jgi:ribosomal protein L11 methyltransferase